MGSRTRRRTRAVMYALVDGEPTEPQPYLTGYCPGCGGVMVPKCGRVNVWHWAHQSLEDCDPWDEPYTRWHADWQKLFPPSWCEVPVGDHRADVRTPTG